MAEEDVAAATDGLGDERETSGCGNLHITDELVPLDFRVRPIPEFTDTTDTDTLDLDRYRYRVPIPIPVVTAQRA